MKIFSRWPFRAAGWWDEVWVEIQIYFEPRDIWVGVYRAGRGEDLEFYLCLVPTFPLHVKLEGFWLGRT